MLTWQSRRVEARGGSQISPDLSKGHEHNAVFCHTCRCETGGVSPWFPRSRQTCVFGPGSRGRSNTSEPHAAQGDGKVRIEAFT